MLRRQVQDVEGKLPEKLTITIKCPMTGYQGAVYDWVKATGLLRIDPACDDAVRRNCNLLSVKNRIMELRKACCPPPSCLGISSNTRSTCSTHAQVELGGVHLVCAGCSVSLCPRRNDSPQRSVFSLLLRNRCVRYRQRRWGCVRAPSCMLCLVST
jgi:hypothetical protein